MLDAEVARLRLSWSTPANAPDDESILNTVLGAKALEKIDLFDKVQLAFVIQICRECHTLSDAGRKLYGATREKRKVQNDADRLRKYLARFDLDWEACKR